MRYSISINELAEQDISEVFLDYEKKLPGLGNDFRLEIEAGVKFISKNAQAIQIRYGIVQIYFLKRFPFGIHFYQQGDNVEIVGVYAMKDNPEKWKRKA